MIDDLKAVFPLEAVVVAGGEEIRIREFRFGQLPRVIDVLGNIYADVQSEDVSLTDLLLKGQAGVADLIALAAGKDRAWVDGLSLGDGVALLGAVIEVNGDFFVHRLGPAIDTLKKALSGLKSYAPSSPPATAGRTSSTTESGRSPSSTGKPRPGSESGASSGSRTPAPPTPKSRH